MSKCIFNCSGTCTNMSFLEDDDRFYPCDYISEIHRCIYKEQEERLNEQKNNTTRNMEQA